MIKRCIKKLLSLIPTKKLIVFESIPNLSDNTVAVFDEMVRRGLNKTYRMVWIVSNKDNRLPAIPGVSYSDKTKRFHKIAWLYYRVFAKALISCNEFLPTLRSGQVSFYLTHGTSIKHVRNYYTVPAAIDYMMVDGPDTLDMMSYELNFPAEKTIALGYPRNDILVNASRDVYALFEGENIRKIAVWYPTFRQHKNGMTATTRALPFLEDEAQAARLNEMAKLHGVLLVLKPHFAQDISKIKACGFSHIRFIDDSFFVQHGITSYEFIASCDALITDYSSVYFDYLLCDKPIGLAWDDYEEYKQSVDFAIDMDYYMQGGEKICDLDGFEVFLKHLSEGRDILKDERARISRWANFDRDGKSAARVTDFIVEKAHL